MARIKVPAWLSPPSSTSSAEGERKKQNFLSTFTSKDESRPIQTPPSPSPGPREDSDLATTPTPEHKPLTVSVTKPGAMTASGTSQMIQLAKRIASETEKLDAYLKERGLPDPGFDVDAPGDFPALPDEVQNHRQAIVYAAMELQALVRGPREVVRWGVWSHLDTLSLQIINHYGIARLVPFEGPISLTDLAKQTRLDLVNLSRTLRHAMTNYIFHEPSPGLIAHTAASKALAEDHNLQAWVGYNTEDHFPAAAHTLEALRLYPEATSLTQAGFNVAFGTLDKEPMFTTYSKDPKRARRMGSAMTSLTGGEGYELRHFISNYDLKDLNEREGSLVDIGGGYGFVCIELAKKWKKMRFAVQDLKAVVANAPPLLDDDLKERITYQVHDIFTEQPVKGADIYYLRWILHNYSTPYAVQILKALVPAMKRGARVVLNEHCLREPGSENPWDEKLMRSMDLVKMSLTNAQERTEAEFRELFKAADERFFFKGVTRTLGCRMSVIEAVWQPEQ